jgi:hypothetical protein
MGGTLHAKLVEAPECEIVRPAVDRDIVSYHDLSFEEYMAEQYTSHDGKDEERDGLIYFEHCDSE